APAHSRRQGGRLRRPFGGGGRLPPEGAGAVARPAGAGGRADPTGGGPAAGRRRGPLPPGDRRQPPRRPGRAPGDAGRGIRGAGTAGTGRGGEGTGRAPATRGRPFSGFGGFPVGVHRDAGAEDVLVAVDVVHARHRRPVLLLAQAGQREHRQLARVGVRPLAGADRLGGVRGVLQRIVLAVELAFLDGADFLADLDHRVDEAVQLVQRLRL